MATRIEKLIDVALAIYLDIRADERRSTPPKALADHCAAIAAGLLDACECRHAATVRVAATQYDRGDGRAPYDVSWLAPRPPR